MRILWFTWKDLKHPQAGGAEVVNEELAKRLIKDGHEVTFIVGGFSGGQAKETVHGYRVIRLGNRYSVYWLAYRYYKKRLKGWADLVIDEVNTVPFFTKFYVSERSILIIHQLARQIWFYQMVFPLSLMGYLLEPLYLRLLNDQKVITISGSSKLDLLRHGFHSKNISIISMGIQMQPVKNVRSIKKYSQPTILSLGAIRPMKRTADQIKAFELTKHDIPSAQLKVAGDASDPYGQKVLKMIKASPYAADIEYLGKVTSQQKVALMQKSHLIMVTSVKEGWGLIVTEAASRGTPAVVYDVDGLRDSVKHNETGLVCPSNTPAGLAKNVTVLLDDHKRYNEYRRNAWRWSKEITFERCYQDFKRIINS